MSLDQATKDRYRLAHEGSVLRMVAEHGRAQTIEISQLQVDGVFNALLRLESRERVAEFAFALSDRIAGGLKGETPVIVPLSPASVTNDAPPKRAGFAWGFFYGICFAIGWSLARGNP